MQFPQNQEIWKSISGYLNYEVSSFGRVRNATTGTILKERMRKNYPAVDLYNNGVRKTFGIHRLVASEFLTNTDGHKYVDHVDGVKTNNIFTNLRWCTNVQNGANRTKQNNNKTGFKGVDQKGKKFRAQIVCRGKKYYLGMFDTKEEAHDAYKQKAIELFGEFAKW